MILYRIGEIVYKNNSNLIFESQGVGYSLIVADNARFESKSKLKLYLYEIKNDYYQATYGFKDFKERLLFIDLISLNGVGPKVAFNILNQGWEKIALYISEGNFEALIETPYLNPKVARLIIAELQDKWTKMIDAKKTKEAVKNIDKFTEVKTTLKMLGFKTTQIDNALQKIKENNDVEIMIEEAIKLMSQNYEPITT
ncbi:Holliday junction branch migration protein RuvA [Mycoplasmopsis lipofaciens]|uniref:Holliday junction branch migration protein RuvA n=1 Tax=Mycoplasmopsis lipofaciens TaxID=114884 RepID=UPI000482348E|nr:Holliday junction branch migration protein RuvA [Mycoplasmopsis lipofaciens]